MAITTNGDVGSSTLSMEEIAEVRYQEAKKSADIIGAELIWIGYHDEFFFDNEESRRRFIDVMRQAEPDVVFTHWVDDYHPDHFNTGKVTRDARIMTAVPNIVSKHAPLKTIPQLFFYDCIAGINFVPEVYVNVTGTFSTKQKMLDCHQSQASWLRDIYGMSYLEVMEIQTRFRGLQADFKYAEGFKALETYPRASNYDLLPFD
jgi:LmbE family N-acetylglucosaminyl deacetylase